MTFVPVTGVVAQIAKAAAQDEDGALELLRLGAYEALQEMIAANRPEIERIAKAEHASRTTAARRALVRDFIDRRLEGADVEDIVKAAAHLTVAEVGVSKAFGWKREKRDKRGRWIADATAMYADPGSGDLGASAALTGGRQEQMRRVGGLIAGTGLPGANAVGGAAMVAGSLTPEAQAVLGRGMRRTAYRYRGTERTPDKGVTDQVRAADDTLSALTDPKRQREALDRIGSQMDPTTRGQTYDGERHAAAPGSPAEKIVTYYGPKNEGKGFTPDQRALAVRGDVAANYLRTKLPTLKQTEISIEAGRVPPSRGLIIDRDGDVVSEAQGFQGDHFVPFDLKNLRRLSGGQYVRTRAMGGPTTEDIYTGLLSGARQIQVVSNSGVFTLELDPSIRGGRRYTDKAGQMVDRYGKLLAAVGGGKLMRVDLDQDTKNRLRNKALDLANGDAGQARTIYGQLEEKERGRATFLTEDDGGASRDQAVAEANQALHSGTKNAEYSRQAIARSAQVLGRDAMDQRVRRMQLDGEGYYSALKSLQEEFPFFIRAVRYDPLPDFVTSRGLGDPEKARDRAYRGTDKGHLQQGQLQLGGARSAKEEVNGRTKEAEPDAPDGPTPPTNRTAAASIPGQTKTGLTTGALVQGVPLHAETEPLKLDLSESRELRAAVRDNLWTMTEYALDNFRPDASVVAGEREFDQCNSAVNRLAWLGQQGEQGQLKAFLALKPAQQELVAQAVKDILRSTPSDQGATSKEQAIKAADSLLPVLQMATPFAAGPAKPLAEPDEDDPLPQPFPEITQLGNKAENYTRYEQRAAQDQELAGFIRAAKGDPDFHEEIHDALKTYNKATDSTARTLQARAIHKMNLAWSFVHAQKMANRIDAGGGASPHREAGTSPAAPAPRGRLTPVGRGEQAPALSDARPLELRPQKGNTVALERMSKPEVAHNLNRLTTALETGDETDLLTSFNLQQAYLDGDEAKFRSMLAELKTRHSNNAVRFGADSVQTALS